MDIASDALRTMSYAASITLDFQVLQMNADTLESLFHGLTSDGSREEVSNDERLMTLKDICILLEDVAKDSNRILSRVLTDVSGDKSSLDHGNIHHMISYFSALNKKVVSIFAVSQDRYGRGFDVELSDVRCSSNVVNASILYMRVLISRIEKKIELKTALIVSGGSRGAFSSIMSKITGGGKGRDSQKESRETLDCSVPYQNALHSRYNTKEILKALSESRCCPAGITWLFEVVHNRKRDHSAWYQLTGRSGLGVFSRSSDRKRHFVIEFPEYFQYYILVGGSLNDTVEEHGGETLREASNLSTWVNWGVENICPFRKSDLPQKTIIEELWRDFRDESVLLGVVSEATPGFEKMAPIMRAIRAKYGLEEGEGHAASC